MTSLMTPSHMTLTVHSPLRGKCTYALKNWALLFCLENWDMAELQTETTQHDHQVETYQKVTFQF